MKVRDVIKDLERDGWRLNRTRGSHRQFKHSTKPGLVTSSGQARQRSRTRYAEQRLEASGAEEMKKYLIVVEKTGTGYSAYSPDLDGCVATGRTREEVEREMQGVITFHLEGMAQSGEPIPEPRTYSAYVEVPAHAQ